MRWMMDAHMSWGRLHWIRQQKARTVSCALPAGPGCGTEGGLRLDALMERGTVFNAKTPRAKSQVAGRAVPTDKRFGIRSMLGGTASHPCPPGSRRIVF